MTRGFVFTLVAHDVVYNLWTDLILAGVTDKTFSNSPYIPKVVSELKSYVPVAGADSVNNAGNNVSYKTGSGAEMHNSISDDTFMLSSSRNAIDLSTINLQGSADNVQVEVTITAL